MCEQPGRLILTHIVSLLLHVVVVAPLKRRLLCRTTRCWLPCSALMNTASDSSC
ncbi:hypothetical protein AHAS_Ahas11G0027900 [Arachis hypogaea]